MKRLFQITGTWRNANALTAAGAIVIAESADEALGAYVRSMGAQFPERQMSSAPSVTDITETARSFVAENPA